MRPRRPAYVLPGLAILAFATFLGLALVRLFLVEQDMRDNVDENMLWVISQAQVASHRLDGAVNRHLLGDTDADPELRFDILVSRLVLLGAGPQRRYLEEIGFAEELDRALLNLEAIEPLLENLEPRPLANDMVVHAHLEPLMGQLNRIANAVMVQEWEATGSRLDAHRRSMLQTIASILGILLSGLLLVALLFHALRQRRDAQRALMAHRDRLEEEVERHICRYRKAAEALTQALKRERGVSEFYRSFAGMVSHQFRTPLAVIDSGLQRLIRRHGDMAPAQRLTRYHQLREAVAQMTRLVESSLTAARLDGAQVEAQPESCNLTDLVEQACRFQSEARGGSQIRVSAQGAPLLAWCDRSLVEQILANLLSNALKYSATTEPISVHLGAEGERLYCRIEDGGIGIPADELPRLFERFFRSRNAREISGLGLGLNIARHLAQIQDGDITVSSVEGEGTTFTLWLPAATGRTQDVDA
ncbi:sensor histidine kinase [Halomonas campaniensis]|uniref:sensor histidine kinase n=1 Tax=Halomonas campaniensis TaxID=213554 RepID=UPI00356220E8